MHARESVVLGLRRAQWAGRPQDRRPIYADPSAPAAGGALTGVAGMLVMTVALVANITMFDNATPVNTSKRLVSSFDFPARRVRRRSGTARSPPRSSSCMSSTRCMDCQKNRYGEIVVPSTATSNAM